MPIALEGVANAEQAMEDKHFMEIHFAGQNRYERLEKLSLMAGHQDKIFTMTVPLVPPVKKFPALRHLYLELEPSNYELAWDGDHDAVSVYLDYCIVYMLENMHYSGERERIACRDDTIQSLV